MFIVIFTASTASTQRCTSEEIAEKRRQAIERLKNRNKQNANVNMNKMFKSK